MEEEKEFVSLNYGVVLAVELDADSLRRGCEFRDKFVITKTCILP